MHVEYSCATVFDTAGDQPFEVKLSSSGEIVMLRVGLTEEGQAAND